MPEKVPVIPPTPVTAPAPPTPAPQPTAPAPPVPAPQPTAVATTTITVREHCWHDFDSVPVGTGSAGTIRHICCFCGQFRRQRWDRVQDEVHGNAFRVFKTVLSAPIDPGPCEPQ